MLGIACKAYRPAWPRTRACSMQCYDAACSMQGDAMSFMRVIQPFAFAYFIQAPHAILISTRKATVKPPQCERARVKQARVRTHLASLGIETCLTPQWKLKP